MCIYAYICIYICVCVYIYIYVYGIHHSKILRSSYRKLVRVGFDEPSEFR